MRKAILLVFIFSFIFRLVGIDRFPTGFTADEAALGYNAYSLLKTGKDEWGIPFWQLPYTNLRSFGDFKLPLYSFLTVPLVKFFGLSVFSVRFPNVLIGSLAVIVVMSLTGKLFSRVRLGLLAGVVFSLMPWNLGLSRGAFETNLVTLLIPLGLGLLLFRRFYLSAIVLTLSLYAYHSAKILTPVFLLSFFLYQFKNQLVNWFRFGLLFLLLALPAAATFLTPGGSRVSDVSLFHPTDNWQSVSQAQFTAQNQGLPRSISRIFTNKLTSTSSQIISGYLSYLSFQFLFTSGVGETTYGLVPGNGLLYLIELPALLIYLVFLIKNPRRPYLLLLIFILISPLGAALAKGPGFAANRAGVMAVFLSMAVAVGWATIPPRFTRSGIWVVGIIYLLSLANYFQKYIYLWPTAAAAGMKYPMKELVTRLAGISPNYSQIQISRTFSSPHIFIAFFTRYDPVLYQQASRHWLIYSSAGYKYLDQYDGYFLGKYRFGNVYLSDPVNQPTLYAGQPQDFNYSSQSPMFRIDYPDSQVAALVYSRSP